MDSKKAKHSFRYGNFLVLGCLVYSFFFWITDRNFAHVFGMILVALCCNILYKMDYKMPPQKEWIKTKDIIYMCGGAILSSLMDGFPFNFLN